MNIPDNVKYDLENNAILVDAILSMQTHPALVTHINFPTITLVNWYIITLVNWYTLIHTRKLIYNTIKDFHLYCKLTVDWLLGPYFNNNKEIKNFVTKFILLFLIVDFLPNVLHLLKTFSQYLTLIIRNWKLK